MQKHLQVLVHYEDDDEFSTFRSYHYSLLYYVRKKDEYSENTFPNNILRFLIIIFNFHNIQNLMLKIHSLRNIYLFRLSKNNQANCRIIYTCRKIFWPWSGSRLGRLDSDLAQTRCPS